MIRWIIFFYDVPFSFDYDFRCVFPMYDLFYMVTFNDRLSKGTIVSLIYIEQDFTFTFLSGLRILIFPCNPESFSTNSCQLFRTDPFRSVSFTEYS